MTTDTTLNSNFIVDAAGITYRQLDYWTRTKLIKPSVCNAKGSGTYRVFSEQDMLHILVIKDLIDNGFDLRHLRIISAKIRKLLKEIKPDYMLVIDGHEVKALDWFDTVKILSRANVPVTVMSMRKIKNKLRNEADGD